MLSLLRRIAAVATVLALSAGNLALCAGWQAAAEARMACCMDDTSCAMHESAHGSGGQHAASQTQADECCAAASNRTQSPLAAASFGLSSPAALPVAIASVVPAAVPALAEWRALVPRPASPVPKHLLLSVLLV